jgi:hypothetical protein
MSDACACVLVRCVVRRSTASPATRQPRPCRWSKCSWFATAPDAHLQASRHVLDGTEVSVLCEGSAKVGGAAAQNRFAGRSARPFATTAPIDGSPILSQNTKNSQQLLGNRGGHVLAAIADAPGQPFKRVASTQQGPGVTCDGSKPERGSGASKWTYDWDARVWKTSEGDAQSEMAVKKVKHTLAARRCDSRLNVCLLVYGARTHGTQCCSQIIVQGR